MSDMASVESAARGTEICARLDGARATKSDGHRLEIRDLAAMAPPDERSHR